MSLSATSVCYPPLHLTDPAPVEAAARLGADHVHAAAVPLGGGPAARARLGDDSDGETAGVRPATPPRHGRPARPPTDLPTGLATDLPTDLATGLAPSPEVCRLTGQTVPEMSPLLAVPAEHEAALRTADPPAVRLRLAQ